MSGLCWLIITGITSQAPYTMCGASVVQEEP